MRAGRLKHTIAIEQLDETQDSHGEPLNTWAPYITRRASVEPLLGREYFAARQDIAEVTTRFRLRYDSETRLITAKMRVSYNGQYYDIESPPINVGEANKEIILMCKGAA